MKEAWKKSLKELGENREGTLEEISGTVHERFTVRILGEINDGIPERTSEKVTDRMPENILYKLPEELPEGRPGGINKRIPTRFHNESPEKKGVGGGKKSRMDGILGQVPKGMLGRRN